MISTKFVRKNCQRFLEILKEAAADAEHPLQWISQAVRDNISYERQIEEPLEWMCNRTLPAPVDGVIQICLVTQIAVPSSDMEHVEFFLGDVGKTEDVDFFGEPYTLFNMNRLAIEVGGDDLILRDEAITFDNGHLV